MVVVVVVVMVVVVVVKLRLDRSFVRGTDFLYLRTSM